MLTDLRYAAKQLNVVQAYLFGVLPQTGRSVAAIDACNRLRDALERCVEEAERPVNVQLDDSEWAEFIDTHDLEAIFDHDDSRPEAPAGYYMPY